MKIGRRYILKDIKNQKVALRFLSMGILPGKEIFICRKTLSGSTIYIQTNRRVYGLAKGIFDSLDLELIPSA